MTGTNLLSNCWRLTSSKEDILTEFLAATLREDQMFASRFTSLLLSTSIQDPPDTIETQVDYPSGCPDMRLRLADGRTILVENKIDADETLRWSGEDEIPEPQLERYLTEPVDGVAYIRADWKPPKQEVIAHPLYLSPKDRPHFLWRDLYPLLNDRESILSTWLRDAFEVFGYVPPVPGVGDLQDPDPEARNAARLNFAKHWDRVRARADRLGWKSEIASKAQLYLTATDPCSVEAAFVSPIRPDRFLIRITPVHSGSDLRSRLMAAYAGMDIDPEIIEKTIRRSTGPVKVIDVISTLPRVLAGEEQPESIAERLELALGPVLELDDLNC